ncbi:hypothetical protein COJ46_09910 [Bacillus sp. AFS077874]|uniref:hypothetical protein n=1 Tax=unclassified Bacillus (in: firmicutes) TaxID=185979 RepID=UPI000BECEB0B|nr:MULTISPECIES: hypothetical protein [unclassified Bacillus (in: firmicutes)]PEC51057.1 hypothetical protein CON00_03210 [Bacillus sp. AFS096315]PFM81224.1 hypothetical protein COJ46_09910 [Bacillus sp. AFS077874]
MKKNCYFLQLELNCKNHMILAINEDTKGARSLIGYMVLEDVNRPGTPNDFKDLHPVFFKDWDDDRNLIFARIYTFDSITEEKQDALIELAETFIEFKPSVNLKLDFFVASEVLKLYENSWENDMKMIPVYQWLIDADSENPISLAKLKIDSLNHLSQDE